MINLSWMEFMGENEEKQFDNAKLKSFMSQLTRRQSMKKSSFLLIFISLLFALSSCGGDNGATAV